MLHYLIRSFFVSLKNCIHIRGNNNQVVTSNGCEPTFPSSRWNITVTDPVTEDYSHVALRNTQSTLHRLVEHLRGTISLGMAVAINK